MESFVDFVEVNSSLTNRGLSVYVNFLQNFVNPYAKVLITFLSSSGKYDLELANTTVNACEFFRNRKYFPILQVFYRALTKSSTFPKKCPILKVKIYFTKSWNWS